VQGERDVITDFQAGSDKILLRGGASVGDVVANAQVVGSDTLLHLGLNHDVTLTGVTGVNASWFG
jgi:Ca2+-binding RTX toxin-like protein